MAPSFNRLAEADLDDDELNEDDIDFSDLREKYVVKLEEGFDAFVVVDGLPPVNDAQKPKLVKFLLKKLQQVGKINDDGLYMPLGEDGQSLRFAFAEYSSSAEAAMAVKKLDHVPLDKTFTLRVNKLTDIDRYGKEGRVDEKFWPPETEEFSDKEHMRWWLKDPAGRGRDQFVMHRGDRVGVYWNNSREQPENIVDRSNWTEIFVQWSTFGTYLTSVHAQGVQFWGCQSWSRLRRFAHPFVNLIAFSPTEKYLVTWSARPITVSEELQSLLSVDDEGKNYIIWDIETGQPLRSFANLDAPAGENSAGDDNLGGKQQPQQQQPQQQQQQQRKYPWPAFKWSSDDRYVGRLLQGTAISIYELPRMSLMDKTAIKIEGVMDFEWAPSLGQRDGVKTYEQLLCYWTPEIGSNPAKVGLMSIPSKQILRTLNLFSVIDAKLHWQSEAAYLCVKVDRHSKSKKFMATTLEIFRVREKGVPVEVVDTIKDTVINFAWEPKGDRFVVITTMEPPGTTAVPPKTSVAFFCPEKNKGQGVGNFRLLRTLEKKNSNAIYWSPRGRFVVIAAIHNPQSSDLDFYDVDFDGDKPESDKDLTANLQLMNTADHYGVTDIEWDPSGRFVATWASQWKHAVENGYHLYDFKGELLREEHVDKFKQWQWRPRPPTLLTRDQQKLVRKNLRQFSLAFEQEDAELFASADLAVVQARRRLLEDWHAWRADIETEIAEERADLDLPPDPVAALFAALGEPEAGAVLEDVIEELVEDVLEENEEIMP